MGDNRVDSEQDQSVGCCLRIVIIYWDLRSLPSQRSGVPAREAEWYWSHRTTRTACAGSWRRRRMIPKFIKKCVWCTQTHFLSEFRWMSSIRDSEPSVLTPRNCQFCNDPLNTERHGDGVVFYLALSFFTHFGKFGGFPAFFRMYFSYPTLSIADAITSNVVSHLHAI